jgi:Fic family protein
MPSHPVIPGRYIPTAALQRVLRDGVPQMVEVTGQAFVPDPLPPKLDLERFIGRLYPDLAAAESSLARLDGVAGTMVNPELLLRPLRMREAKLSSQIENTLASAEEIALVDAGRPVARHEGREVWNYLRALEHGLASPLPLCNRLIKEMHAILMEGVRGEDKGPGEYRKVQNYIGTDGATLQHARFVPPPPAHVGQAMDDLERFLNTRSEQLPWLLATAMAHYQFECIHPFRDGNGRLGRLLIALSMCKAGVLARPLVYISAYFEQHRQIYYDLLLRVSARGDWEEWVRFFCTGISTQAEDGIARSRRLRDLRDHFRKQLSARRASALSLILVDHLFQRPAVTNAGVCELLSVTPPTAQLHIDSLVSKGILTEITGGSYGRVYMAKSILSIIEADQLDPEQTPL